MRELIGVDELVALFRRQIAHPADGRVDGLAAVGRELLELPKQLTRAFFLIGGQVLPGLHAVEHALLLIGRQAGKTLQLLLQALLLLRGELAEFGVVLQFATLLFGGKIAILAKPVAGVVGRVLLRVELRTNVSGTVFILTGLVRTRRIWAVFVRTRLFLQLALALLLLALLFPALLLLLLLLLTLLLLTLLLLAELLGMGMRLRPCLRMLGEGRREQQNGRQTAHDSGPSQHSCSLRQF